MFWSEVNLVCRLLLEKKKKDEALDAVNGAGNKVIILDGLERHFREALQDSQRLRALNGKLRIALTGIFDSCASANVLEILILITRIHAKEIVRARNFVHEQIVHEGALLGHQPGIVRLPNGEPRRIIAGNVLHQIESAFSADLDLAHVADIKEARASARCHVLGENAGIFHGHVPSAEVDHLGAPASMYGVQCGLSKLCRGWRRHAGFSAIATQK